MNYRIDCECGKALTVQESMAGVDVPCVCGRVVKVPPWRELRSGRFPVVLEPTETRAADQTGIVIKVLLGTGVLALASVFIWLGSIAGAGLVLVVAGRIWMLAVGFSVNRNLGCLLVLFPEIMMILFAANNPKLALPPLLCVLVGVILVATGLAMHG
jgi:hypothetical protein